MIINLQIKMLKKGKIMNFMFLLKKAGLLCLAASALGFDTVKAAEATTVQRLDDSLVFTRNRPPAALTPQTLTTTLPQPSSTPRQLKSSPDEFYVVSTIEAAEIAAEHEKQQIQTQFTHPILGKPFIQPELPEQSMLYSNTRLWGDGKGGAEQAKDFIERIIKAKKFADALKQFENSIKQDLACAIAQECEELELTVQSNKNALEKILVETREKYHNRIHNLLVAILAAKQHCPTCFYEPRPRPECMHQTAHADYALQLLDQTRKTLHAFTYIIHQELHIEHLALIAVQKELHKLHPKQKTLPVIAPCPSLYEKPKPSKK
jgi:hypothetical protein